MAKKPNTQAEGGPARIDPEKQYRVTLRRAVKRGHGVILPPGDPRVRVSGRVLAEIMDAVDGEPVEV